MKTGFARAAALAALCLVGIQAVQAGNLYRWKDADGHMVVSDRPPETGIQYETISTSSSLVHNVDEETAPAPAAQSRPAAASNTKAEEPEPASKSTVYEKNPDYCKAARENLKVIESAPRIRMPGKDGELHYLTDEEREQQRQQNLDVIKAHCD